MILIEVNRLLLDQVESTLEFLDRMFVFFQTAYWMNTTIPISSLRALYPEAQLLVDDLLLHRRQGKLSMQHSASTAVMKHDLGLQHSGSKQRHPDFKEKLVRK